MIWTIFPTAFYASFRSRSILSHKKKLEKINSVKRNNFCATLTSACIQLKFWIEAGVNVCAWRAHQLSNLSQRGYTPMKG